MTQLTLTVIFAVVLVAGAQRSPCDSAGNRHLLSGYSIIFASFVLYGFFPAVLILLRGGEFFWAPGFENNGGFTRALLFTFAAWAAFSYGYTVSLRRRSCIDLRPSRAPRQARGYQAKCEPRGTTSPVPSTATFTPAPFHFAVALIVVGLMLRFYVVLELGGVGQTIARLSGGARTQLALDGASPRLVGLRTLGGLADLGATWLVVIALRSNRSVKLPAVVFAIVIASSFLVSGKRLLVILPVLVIACAIHAFRRPLTYRMAPLVLLLVPALGMGTLMLRVFLPASEAGIVIDLDDVNYSNGSTVGFYFNSLEFSSTEMIAVADQSGERINSMFGGGSAAFIATNLTPFTYAIPSAIYPGKPDSYLDMSHGVAAVVENIDVHYATVGYACTLVGTTLITGGIVGLILGFMLLGWIVRRWDERHVDIPTTFASLVLHALILAVLFQFFRQGTLGWTFIVAIFQQYGFLAGTFLMRDRKSPRVPTRQAVK